MLMFQMMSMMRFADDIVMLADSDTAKAMYNETKKENAQRITNENKYSLQLELSDLDRVDEISYPGSKIMSVDKSAREIKQEISENRILQKNF